MFYNIVVFINCLIFSLFPSLNLSRAYLDFNYLKDNTDFENVRLSDFDNSLSNNKYLLFLPNIYEQKIQSVVIDTRPKKDVEKKENTVENNKNIEVIQNNEQVEVVEMPVQEEVITVPTNNSKEDEISSLLLSHINNLRSSLGLNTLAVESFLVNIGQIRANEASYCWSHTRPDGSFSLDLIPLDRYAGENLAYKIVYDDISANLIADQMYTALYNSPSHYDNMVYADFNKIGIYTYKSTTDDGGIKYTSAMMFSS